MIKVKIERIKKLLSNKINIKEKEEEKDKDQAIMIKMRIMMMTMMIKRMKQMKIMKMVLMGRAIKMSQKMRENKGQNRKFMLKCQHVGRRSLKLIIQWEE